jgi:hypothetical protein
VFFTVWELLGAHGLKNETELDSGTLFDLIKLSFGVVAGAGALVALVVAYRKQRVDEDAALRETTRLHTERFTAAVSQLGDTSPAIRLGGVHALAGLADDAPTRDLRQTAIDVLCAYLRLPYTPEADLPAGDTSARHDDLAGRQVRHTIVRLIRDHLRHEPGHPHSWQGHDLDFTSVAFDGGDFSHALFSGGTVNFGGAQFTGGLAYAGVDGLDGVRRADDGADLDVEGEEGHELGPGALPQPDDRRVLLPPGVLELPEPLGCRALVRCGVNGLERLGFAWSWTTSARPDRETQVSAEPRATLTRG